LIRAVFKGGPFDGQDMGLAGKVPGYLLLMDGAPVGWTVPVIVGADFDDDWPGQVRYEIEDELLDDVGEDGSMPTVVYAFAGGDG
jgi:hypothetical protein